MNFLKSKIMIFTVHIDPNKPDAYEAPEFIQEGLNMKVFVFGLIIANTLGKFMNWGSASIGFILIAFVFLIASEWNDVRRKILQRKGWIITDIVTGDSLISAKQRFFDRYFRQHQAATHSQVSSLTLPSSL